MTMPSAVPIVGLIANPASSKDIRRLVGLGRVVDVEEKANIGARFLVGLTAAGPVRVLALDDRSGVVRRAVHLARRDGPDVEFLPVVAVMDEADTHAAAVELRSLGAAAVAVIGGDGTARAAVEGWPDAPLVPLAAGTNNAVGIRHEPTVVGAATARAVTDPDRSSAFAPILRLDVVTGSGTASALVDVVGVRSPWTGARALWEPAELTEAITANIHPRAIGIAAISAAFGPLERNRGRYLRFGPGRTVRVALGPGMVRSIDVAEVRDLEVGGSVRIRPESRLLALDGERRLAGDTAGVTLALGPRLLDVTAAMRTPERENRGDPSDRASDPGH